MTVPMSQAGYLQIKEKLAGIELRLLALAEKGDLDLVHRAEVEAI
jgi:hypothetical protein